jgi:hypothetical protein
MQYLVLTVDYEIFGNGTGDVRQHIIEPTDQMVKLGKKYCIPFTFFVEVEEYLAFVKYKSQLKSKLTYDPAQLLREQIQDLINSGNDVQLHIHPEWFNAQYENNKWILNKEKSTVDSLFEDPHETTHYIAERKGVLEDIIQEVAPGRAVTAYRAGAFCAQPGQKLLTALAENQILIESSVVKGLYKDDSLGTLDFRGAPPNKKFWLVSEDVCMEDKSGRVFEVPIYSKMGRRFQQATIHRLKAKFSRNVPQNRQRDMIQQLGFKWNPINMFKFLFQSVPIKLDFHNLSSNSLIKWIKSSEHSQMDVLILIGHTKEHINNDNLEQFLNKISTFTDLQVITFHQLAKMLTKPQKGTINDI